MKTLTTVIVDDEYLAVQILREYAKRIPSIVIEATFTRAEEALEFLKTREVNLLFLDVQMPFLTGFELLEKLPVKPMVIFTTARHDYASRAYEFEVLDYLVKPIPPERFEKAVRKAIEFAGYLESQSQKSQYKDHIMIRSDHRMVKVELGSLSYFEGWGEYVKVHTNMKTFVTLATLKNFEDEIPSGQFIRIHKSYLVSVSRIVSFTAQEIELEGNIRLPIGRAFKQDVLHLLRK